MLRFLIAIITNLKHGPAFISTMRKMTKHPEKYSERDKYAYALKIVRALMKSARISTKIYFVDILSVYICMCLAEHVWVFLDHEIHVFITTTA